MRSPVVHLQCEDRGDYIISACGLLRHWNHERFSLKPTAVTCAQCKRSSTFYGRAIPYSQGNPEAWIYG